MKSVHSQGPSSRCPVWLELCHSLLYPQGQTTTTTCNYLPGKISLSSNITLAHLEDNRMVALCWCLDQFLDLLILLLCRNMHVLLHPWSNPNLITITGWRNANFWSPEFMMNAWHLWKWRVISLQSLLTHWALCSVLRRNNGEAAYYCILQQSGWWKIFTFPAVIISSPTPCFFFNPIPFTAVCSSFVKC